MHRLGTCWTLKLVIKGEREELDRRGVSASLLRKMGVLQLGNVEGEVFAGQQGNRGAPRRAMPRGEKKVKYLNRMLRGGTGVFMRV